MKLVDRLIKFFYWPVCRAYARHFVGDKPANSEYRLLCTLPFWRVHRFWPDFVHPRRFSEKLWSFMFFNRDPQLTILTDKLLVRDFVAAKVGKDHLIHLLWNGNKPEEIPFDALPMKFVIKANHGCGYNIIVRDNTQLNQVSARLQLKKWLNKNYCQDNYLGTEWGYKNIKPTLIIESFLEEHGKVPVDYKLYCFSGRVEFLSIHFDRYEGHKYKSFNRDFEPYDLRYDLEQWSGEFERPTNYKAIVQMAESLSEGLDFMRVDLYSLENRIYFGELTPYPGGGFARFLPPSRDCFLGEKWDLKIKDSNSPSSHDANA